VSLGLLEEEIAVGDSGELWELVATCQCRRPGRVGACLRRRCQCLDAWVVANIKADDDYFDECLTPLRLQWVSRVSEAKCFLFLRLLAWMCFLSRVSSVMSLSGFLCVCFCSVAIGVACIISGRSLCRVDL
jgi:hypothetical protein